MSASDLERLQRAFLDNVPDMAWLKDRSSRYEAVNAAYLNASGFSAEEIVGRTPAEIWPADIAATYLETDRAVSAAASRGAMKRRARSPMARCIGSTPSSHRSEIHMGKSSAPWAFRATSPTARPPRRSSSPRAPRFERSRLPRDGARE